MEPLRSRCLILLAVLTVALPAPRADAQEPTRNLRVFFDCNANCDENYLRLETPWVDFVRDRSDADVHLLITSLSTGAGGQRYTLAFLGQRAFAGRGDTLTYVFNVGETDDVGRRGLTRTIQLGLAPYVARTPAALRVRMALDESAGQRTQQQAPAHDPWRSWVFDVDAFGNMQNEERQSAFEWGSSMEATRITGGWKFGAHADAFFNESRFTIEDDTGASQEIETIRESYSGGAVLVKSLGAHWGAGVQARVSRSTFANTRRAIRVAPAVEYSVFPYDQFTNRQLILQYSAGVSDFQYRDTTIFGRIAETRPTHALVLAYDLTQPWGEVDVTLETSRYLDNSAQWRFSADGELELRVTRGFSIEVGGNASQIRDQLSIPKRGATPEEILLELRELQSDYRYSMYLSLSYTFGSIFNAVVNPRFGTGPGQILR